MAVGCAASRGKPPATAHDKRNACSDSTAVSTVVSNSAVATSIPSTYSSQQGNVSSMSRAGIEWCSKRTSNGGVRSRCWTPIQYISLQGAAIVSGVVPPQQCSITLRTLLGRNVRSSSASSRKALSDARAARQAASNATAFGCGRQVTNPMCLLALRPSLLRLKYSPTVLHSLRQMQSKKVSSACTEG